MTWQAPPGFEEDPEPPPGQGTGKGRANGQAKGEAKPLPFKMLDELKLSTAPFWLIDGYLVRSPMMMIYGPAGSGKTYLGVSVAIGMLLAQWFGRATEPGSVLICSFERHDDSEDRLAALRDRHGMTGKRLPLALVDMTGQCLDAEAESRIIVTAKAIVEKSAQPMRAILIDTVAAACGGREQTPGLQGELRDAGNRIAAATGAIVCWIQHEGKTSHNGPIGYLDLANSCSTWWRVEEREDGSRVVHVDKANRGPVHVPLFAFRLDTVHGGAGRPRQRHCAVRRRGSRPRRRPGQCAPAAVRQAPEREQASSRARLAAKAHGDGAAEAGIPSPGWRRQASAQIGFRAEGGSAASAKGGPALSAASSHPKVQSNPPFHASARPPATLLIEENDDGTLALAESS